MWHVFRRELQSYFSSAIGYAFMGFFMLVTGAFFTLTNLLSMNSSYSTVLGDLTYIFMLLVPILTMRLLSEEKKNKTDQMLITSPLSLASIVIGKYLAAVTVFMMTLLCTLVYPIMLTIYGNPNWLEIVGGYIGFFFIGSAFISIGVFMSALSENQMTAAASTFAVLLLIYVVDFLLPVVEGYASSTNVLLRFFAGLMAWVLNWLALYSYYTDFSMGVLGLSPIVYYISFSALFVFLTVQAIDKRRWSKG